MDPRERIGDPEEAFRTAVEGLLSGLWTAIPCYVTKINFADMTVELQPTIMAKIRQQDGTLINVKLPILLDVPIMFQGGGGFTATFPIAAGDEALAIFATLCIDSWWQSSGVQTQAELRMHDLSDAFALIGPRSKPRVISGISTNSAQLRTDDGTTFAEVKSDQTVNIAAPAGMTINAPFVSISGIITVLNESAEATASTIHGTLRTTNGDIIAETGDVVATTISLKTHIHSGVQPGSGDTGEPVP